MKVGVHLVNFTLPGGPPSIGPTLAAVGRAAEDAGVANLSLMDHYLQLGHAGAADEPMLEGYTSLGFLAAHTTTVGAAAAGHRGHLPASRAAGQDRLDPRRALRRPRGARHRRGLVRARAPGLGVPYPPVAERFERLEETLQIVRQMWSDDDGPFEGRHYRLAETINSPQPLRRPPIMIGGGGEKKTLRLVARYADACNLFASPARRPGPGRRRSSTSCASTASARAPTTTPSARRSSSRPLEPGPTAAARFAEQMAGYAAVGVSEVHVMPLAGDPLGFVRNLGEHVIPRIATCDVQR